MTSKLSSSDITRITIISIVSILIFVLIFSFLYFNRPRDIDQRVAHCYEVLGVKTGLTAKSSNGKDGFVLDFQALKETNPAISPEIVIAINKCVLESLTEIGKIPTDVEVIKEMTPIGSLIENWLNAKQNSSSQDFVQLLPSDDLQLNNILVGPTLSSTRREAINSW